MGFCAKPIKLTRKNAKRLIIMPRSYELKKYSYSHNMLVATYVFENYSGLSLLLLKRMQEGLLLYRFLDRVPQEDVLTFRDQKMIVCFKNV